MSQIGAMTSAGPSYVHFCTSVRYFTFLRTAKYHDQVCEPPTHTWTDMYQYTHPTADDLASLSQIHWPTRLILYGRRLRAML